HEGQRGHQAGEDPGQRDDKEAVAQPQLVVHVAHGEPQEHADERAGQEAAEEHRRRALLVPHQRQEPGRQLGEGGKDDNHAQDAVDGAEALAHSQVAPVWNRALTRAISRLSITNRMTWSPCSMATSWWAISSFSPRTMPPMVV